MSRNPYTIRRNLTVPDLWGKRLCLLDRAGPRRPSLLRKMNTPKLSFHIRIWGHLIQVYSIYVQRRRKWGKVRNKKEHYYIMNVSRTSHVIGLENEINQKLSHSLVSYTLIQIPAATQSIHCNSFSGSWCYSAGQAALSEK